MTEGKLCRTYWGSHGCSLPRGHAGWLQRHQCGRADDPEDELCCTVERGVDDLTGLMVWDNVYNGGTDRYPVAIFGEDVPAGHGGEQAAVDTVFRARQKAGQLATMVNGRWVKLIEGEAVRGG